MARKDIKIYNFQIPNYNATRDVVLSPKSGNLSNSIFYNVFPVCLR